MEKEKQINNDKNSNIRNFYYQASIIEQNCHKFENNNEVKEKTLDVFNELYDVCKKALYDRAEFLAEEELRCYDNSSAMIASTFLAVISAVITSLICIATGLGIVMSSMVVLASMMGTFIAVTAIPKKTNISKLNQEELKYYTDYFYQDLLKASGIQKCYDDVIKSINEQVIDIPKENNFKPNMELDKSKVLTKHHK